jgi:geranylgeranyl diphosphate synthase type I
LDDDAADTLRTILRATGADQAVERMIEDRYDQAQAALEAAHLPPDVHARLRELAEHAVWRSS